MDLIKDLTKIVDLTSQECSNYAFKPIMSERLDEIVLKYLPKDIVTNGKIIENGYLIKIESDSYFNGSLIEPASCVIRGYKANMHLDDVKAIY